MSIRKILTEPDKILRQISQPVEVVGNEEQDLMRDMLETMYAAKGIGLAAIQVGVPKRVIVLDIAKKDEQKQPMHFINPEIIEKSQNNSSYEEGCLSVPGQFAEIERPDKSMNGIMEQGDLDFEWRDILVIIQTLFILC